MIFVDSIQELVTTADVIIILVSDNAACEAIFESSDGILAHLTSNDKIIVDMSTISPEISIRMSQRVREKGGRMLDAPLSGNHTIVLERKAATMVGGDRDVFDRIVRPILLSLGPRVTFIGDNGAGLSLKVALNLSIAVQMLAFSEGVLLAERAGVDKALAVEVMTHSAIASPMLQYRGSMVLEAARPGFFNTRMMQKDVQLALELGERCICMYVCARPVVYVCMCEYLHTLFHNSLCILNVCIYVCRLSVPLPSTTVASYMLTQAEQQGLGECDFAAVYHTLAALELPKS
jgi:3-hydroxyisobutyrate dehydrogenase-like beta-hydroxyacid dehydrogenase